MVSYPGRACQSGADNKSTAVASAFGGVVCMRVEAWVVRRRGSCVVRRGGKARRRERAVEASRHPAQTHESFG